MKNGSGEMNSDDIYKSRRIFWADIVWLQLSTAVDRRFNFLSVPEEPCHHHAENDGKMSYETIKEKYLNKECNVSASLMPLPPLAPSLHLTHDILTSSHSSIKNACRYDDDVTDNYDTISPL